MLQRGTLGRRFELVLELQPVDHVGLLSDAPPAEVAVADARRQLDGLGDFVDRQLAQLPGLDQLVGGAYLGLHQANAFHLDPDLIEFQGLRLQLDENAGRLAGAHANALDRRGGVAEQGDRHRPIPEGHRHQYEAAVGRGRGPEFRALDDEEGILEHLAGGRVDDAAQDASRVLRRSRPRHGQGHSEAEYPDQFGDPTAEEGTLVHETAPRRGREAARARVPGSVRPNALANSSTLARSCTGRCSSTSGRSARMPAARGANFS